MQIDIAAKSRADELTDAEIAVAVGGYHNPGADRLDPIQYAVSYWTSVGIAGTLRDFRWQLMN